MPLSSIMGDTMKKHTIIDLFNICGCEELVMRKQYTCNCCENYSFIRRACEIYKDKLSIAEAEGNTEDVMEWEEYKESFLFNMLGDTCVDEYGYFFIDEHNSLVLVEYANDMCFECEEDELYSTPKIYCSDMPKPEGFESVVKYHGIVALSRQNLDAGIKHLRKVVTTPSYETCCATAPIGAVGAILNGDVITASNKDLYSQVGSKGRYFELEEEGDAYYGIIHYADQLRPADTDGAMYCNELVTINNSVDCIWVKIWATEEEKRAAIELAEFYEVELMIIDEAVPRRVEQDRFMNGFETNEFYEEIPNADLFNGDLSIEEIIKRLEESKCKWNDEDDDMLIDFEEISEDDLPF